MKLQTTLALALAATLTPASARSQDSQPVITVQGQSYSSWGAYTQHLLAQGQKCGAPVHDATRFPTFNPSDCAYGSTNPTAQYDPQEVCEITVVFHVIQNTSGQGFVSSSKIQSQIDILNEDFRAIAGSNGGNGDDSMLQFKLATEDENGNPTTGITYSTNNNWFNDNGQYWNTLAWDTDRYLNVYTNDAGGFLGYVPDIPQGGIVGTAADRVVLLWSAVGNNAPIGPPFNKGRTATHEVGHYLGLIHTFNGGCGLASQCYTTGDLICDTNREAQPNFGCNQNASSCGSPDPIDNYMDYSDDLCMERFTVEQIRRMRCTLEFWRPFLGVCGPTTNDAVGFNVDVGTGFGTPGAGHSAAGAQSGTWNGVTVAAAQGGTQLTDTNGNATSAFVSVSGGNSEFSFDNASTNGNVESLLDDLHDAGTSTWTVSGLAAGDYEVFVYSWAPDNRVSFFSDITVVGGSQGAQTCGGQGWTGSYTYGAQYVSDTVSSNGTITIEVDAAPQNTPTSLNGFQIVPIDGGGLGTVYCSPNADNSTGQPAVIVATGTAVASQNDLTLSASQMPTNQFGYFLTSETTGFTPNPGNSVGTLCLGGQIARFNSQVQNTGQSGSFAIAVDLSSIPTSPPVAVAPGDTWSYQAWYRDGAVSNFTDAITIAFQ